MINNIQIEGYKSIKEANLDLNSINVLIGSNGVGKSNFISFFKLVNNIYEKRLENYTLRKGAENLLYFGSKTTNFIRGYLEFDNKNSYDFILESAFDDRLFITEEGTSFNKSKGNPEHYGEGWTRTRVSSNAKESNIKDRRYGIPYFVGSYLETFKIYHFHDTSDNSPLRASAILNDNIVLREDGGNLAAFLYYLQEKHIKHFKRIENTIKSVAPYFERFELRPDRLNEEKINLEWREVNNPDLPFNASHLSDGTLRFVALTTLLMQPELPEVIIIDEPELGLHPVAIYTLAGLIKKASSKTQIIISTQSVNLVANFEPENIITVDRVGRQSVFNRLEKDKLNQWLSDFTLGDLWLKNIIGGQPY
ncbi:AAA family ATPase [Elizabethkingia anophelis]|uniref:AAA family ATPase n=1 Tax=Elizabethkingia anophelis TaxID=1117645 RepID=UPI0020B772FD|nr:AAA family ATPase [Elizabethkingia anophelis]MDV3498923.1 ATPase [Elizabethkingia anophelis]MDV3995465.1 ATPase [Elizabethkingia anophelis]UTG65766.1 AAA family ATPase [Elizabethkingia anophelis]